MMNKIKAIQKGSGEEALYFTTVMTSYQKEQIEKGAQISHVVDKIEQSESEKEITYNEHWDKVGSISQVVYNGYRKDKLVFTMTSNDITIWYYE